MVYFLTAFIMMSCQRTSALLKVTCAEKYQLDEIKIATSYSHAQQCDHNSNIIDNGVVTLKRSCITVICHNTYNIIFKNNYLVKCQKNVRTRNKDNP